MLVTGAPPAYLPRIPAGAQCLGGGSVTAQTRSLDPSAGEHRTPAMLDKFLWTATSMMLTTRHHGNACHSLPWATAVALSDLACHMASWPRQKGSELTGCICRQGPCWMLQAMMLQALNKQKVIGCRHACHASACHLPGISDRHYNATGCNPYCLVCGAVCIAVVLMRTSRMAPCTFTRTMQHMSSSWMFMRASQTCSLTTLTTTIARCAVLPRPT